MTQTNFPAGVLPTNAAMDAPEPQPLDKRLVQERNRTAILHWLWRFGWLTSRMISALVWPDASYSAVMTRRTLQQLVDEKLVIARAMTTCGTAYLLASKGARLLSEQCGVNASSGNALTIGNAMHRACSNWYLIRAFQRGLGIVTEHEIATERGPCRILHGKQADGIVVADGGACVWVECENSKKGPAERNKTCGLVQSCLGQVPPVELAPGLWLARVAVVATNEQALRWMAASFQQFHREGGASG